MLVPLTLTLISDAFAADKRGAAIGIWGRITGLGVAAGPVVGGAIAQGLSWQWIFWLNVPVGLAVAALSRLRLAESRGPRPQLDLAGTALAGAGLFALTWAPVRARATGWGSPEVTGTLAVSAVLMAAFLAWERRARYPMLPLAYFGRRGFTTANAVIFFQFISVIGSLFFITQLFQLGMGYSPLQAGLRILVRMAMPMVVAPIAGALADKVGNKPFMVAGLFRSRMSWTLPWYSSYGSDFNYDFHVSNDEAIAPVEYNYKDKATLEREGLGYYAASNSDGQGISVFVRDGNQVFHTYSAYGVGADVMLSTDRFLDLTPAGRQWYVSQWPLHDTYGQPGGHVH